MDGWKFDLRKLPNLAIVYGPNASGKTALINRASEGAGSTIIYINQSLLKAITLDGHSSAGQAAQDYVLRVLDRSGTKSTIFLIDDTCVFGSKEIRRLCTKLRELRRQHRVRKAFITRLGERFRVKAI